jgi:fructokinase
MSTDAVVIWGELLWDRFVAGRGGDPARPGDGGELGGAPTNVAWHLAQAGGWAQLATRVGDDADGRRALALLDGLVDTSLVQIDPRYPTGEVTIALEHGEPRFTLHGGRAWEHIECTDAVDAAIRDAGAVVYGTLSQRTPGGVAQWRRAVAAAGAHALKIYDANLRPNDQASHAIAEALDVADVVKLNDREVGELGQLFGWADPIARLGAPAPGGYGLFEGGRNARPGALPGKPRVVVVTHGAAGSTIYPVDGAPIEIAGVRAAPGGDNVGCGDAYLALFVFGMTSGWDLASSGRIASRWAAAVAEVRGATPRFEDERIAELLELPVESDPEPGEPR